MAKIRVFPIILKMKKKSKILILKETVYFKVNDKVIKTLNCKNNFNLSFEPLMSLIIIIILKTKRTFP